MKYDKTSTEFYAPSRDAWREWLTTNHAVRKNIWLILYKKGSGVPCVSGPEAVEEALCFGWIDSKPAKRDAKSFLLYFADRKKGSVWSAINKVRIARLIKEGRMTDAGMKKITAAKKDGSWATLDSVDALQMPADLKKAFVRNKKAATFFENFPPGVKKQIYFWIQSAKRKETLDARVKETVALAARNERANQWKPKK